jgi:hypothetical protein
MPAIFSILSIFLYPSAEVFLSFVERYFLSNDKKVDELQQTCSLHPPRMLSRIRFVRKRHKTRYIAQMLRAHPVALPNYR